MEVMSYYVVEYFAQILLVVIEGRSSALSMTIFVCSEAQATDFSLY